MKDKPVNTKYKHQQSVHYLVLHLWATVVTRFCFLSFKDFSLVLLLCSLLWLWGSTFWMIFVCVCVCVCDCILGGGWSLSNHWGRHVLSPWMVHAGFVFFASIHPSRTWMSGSFESVWWNACGLRLDLGLYCHPKRWGGGGGVKSEPMLTPRENNPLLQGQRRMEYTMLHQAGQRAQHTTDWAI